MTKQNQRNKKGPHAGGMPSFEPTDAQRVIVLEAAGMGLTQDSICRLIRNERTNEPVQSETQMQCFPLPYSQVHAARPEVLS
jgi:hypothetical protein